MRIPLVAVTVSIIFVLSIPFYPFYVLSVVFTPSEQSPLATGLQTVASWSLFWGGIVALVSCLIALVSRLPAKLKFIASCVMLTVAAHVLATAILTAI